MSLLKRLLLPFSFICPAQPVWRGRGWQAARSKRAALLIATQGVGGTKWGASHSGQREVNVTAALIC